MTNIDLYPLQDNYESKLSQPYDWTSSIIYVDSIPTATLPWWFEVIVTINPWTSFAQAVKVNGWSTGQLNVSSTTVEKGNGVNYSTTSHGAKSPIIISDNFAYWKPIATAVNSKAWLDSPTFTGSLWLPTYADATARNAAIPTPTQAMMVKTNNIVQHYNSATVQREDFDIWTPPPNASDTVKWVVEMATPAEVTAGTSIWVTGARTVVWPAELKTVTDWISVSVNNLSNKYIIWGFWNGVDWDVTITTTVTLTEDMYYNNLAVNSPWILNTNWFRVFVAWTFSGNGTVRNIWNNWGNWAVGSQWGNTTQPWWVWWIAWAIINQWTLNFWLAWVSWWNGAISTVSSNPWTAWLAWAAWVASTPSYVNINWATWSNWWAWWANWLWTAPWGAGWTWGAGWVSTRGKLYNLFWVTPLFQFASISSFWTQYKWPWSSWWGAWGWAWWAGSASTAGWASWGWGWGSWSTGWMVSLLARIFNFTWTISVAWGNWGNWGNGSFWWAQAAWSSWWWGSGWGSWGSWWNWWVIYVASTNYISLWTTVIAWGAGWTGWTWGAWWTWSTPWVAGWNWNTWTAWGSWVLLQFTI